MEYCSLLGALRVRVCWSVNLVRENFFCLGSSNGEIQTSEQLGQGFTFSPYQHGQGVSSLVGHSDAFSDQRHDPDGDNRYACLVSGNAWRRHDRKMEPQAGRRVSPFRVTKRRNDFLRKNTRRSRVHVQTIGLNAETKQCRHRADGEICLLTTAFIGLAR
jgi:hypothetical protein